MKSESIHFANLFLKGCFKVPWHQRRYDWRREHVSALLQDINDAMKNRHDFYFLGSLSLIDQGDSVWGVNDGQQRMTTYSMICACFLRLFHSKNEKSLESMAMRVLFQLSSLATKSLIDAEKETPRFTPPPTKDHALIY